MMEVIDIVERVKHIELKSRRKSSNLMSGLYCSAFKGQGMTFSEVRPYQFGDDIRRIDWNKTARFQTPYVKVMEEEREMTIMLMVDVSASTNYATKNELKSYYIAEICACLGLAAVRNQDKVGLILFSDTIKKIVPPRKGRKHVLSIISQIIKSDFKASKCNLDKGLSYLLNAFTRKILLVVFSDFQDVKIGKNLMIASRKYEVLGVKVSDEKDSIIPDVGYACFKDAETGQMLWANTSDSRWRYNFAEYQMKMEKKMQSEFQKHNAHWISLNTNDDYTKDLMHYFQIKK